MRKCSICGKYFEGWDNNAQPISNGICCNECNLFVVLPKRIELSKKKEKKV